MSKYIDLADRMIEQEDFDYGFMVRATLHWLDDHLDQVPGRTITESEYDRLTSHRNPSFGDGFDAGMLAIGGGVIPDPEPTNAEKLEQIVMDADVDSLGGYETLAEYLDKAGVKAPNHD